MTGKITGALREQSDWEQQDENRLGFIKNKPFYDARKTENIIIPVTFPSVAERMVINVTDIQDGYIALNHISNFVPSYEEYLSGVYYDAMGSEMKVSDGNPKLVEEGGLTFYSSNGPVLVVAKNANDFFPLPVGLYEFLPCDSEGNIDENVLTNAQTYGAGHFSFPRTTGELKTIDPKYLPTEVVNLDSYQGSLDGVYHSISEWILTSMSDGKTYGVGDINDDEFFKNIENKENVVFTLTAGTNILHLKEISRAYTTAITGYPKLVSVSLQTSFRQPGSANVVYVGVTLWGGAGMLMINTHVTPVAM